MSRLSYATGTGLSGVQSLRRASFDGGIEASSINVLGAPSIPNLGLVPPISDPMVVPASVLVGDERQLPGWRAPPEAHTSGSVVFNSMALLPADESIAQSQAAQNSAQARSSVPTAMTADGSGQSPDISTASGSGAAEQNQSGTSRAEGQIARDDVAVELTGSGQDDGMWNVTQRSSEQVTVHNRTDRGGDGEADCGVVESGGDSVGARQPSGAEPTELTNVMTVQRGGSGTGRLLAADSISARYSEPPAENKILLACSNDAKAGVVPVVQDDFFSAMSTPVVEETESSLSTTNETGLFLKTERTDRPIDTECREEQEDISLIKTRSASTANEHQGDAENISNRYPRTKSVEALKVGATEYENTKDVSNTENEAAFALPWSDRELADPRAVTAENVVEGKAEDASLKAILERNSFWPSSTFTGGNPGCVFKLGDRGLGFYVDGYIDRVTKDSCVPAPRAWNAGPGDNAIRRGPIGPIRKPVRKITTLRKRKDEQVHAGEDSDARPFMARMVAQRNSRGFQSKLLDREHVLDTHILSLLDKFNDPSVFKKKHGYNVHGQMLGKDGKMIVKPHVEKTEEEKAKLSWYRKVYEDRLGKHLPNKRLGDSIEARREAYAYSRYFTAELNGRQNQLNYSLQNALKGVTKLEFITEDYHFPGAYNTDGKVILEKGAPVSNELHQTEEQKERACSFRFKAIRRYRAAHDDIVGAMSKKEKALQQLFKKADPFLLQEIAQEALESSGTGIYRQEKRDGGAGVDPEANSFGTTVGGQTRSPEQLRDEFSQTLKAQIRNKDKTLLKEVAALADKDADQMIDDFGKGVEIFPHSWRQDRTNIRDMERRRKELIVELEADRRKTVCPWRPGGLHIAQEPWQPFLPRNRGPPVRCASEGQRVSSRGVANDVQGATTNGNGERTSIRGAAGTAACSSDNKGTVPRRPHTAPTPRRKEFIDRISVRARRILGAQSPGMPLHTAFSVYSNDPYPLESTQRSHRGPGDLATGRAAGDFSPPRIPGYDCWAEVGEGRKRAWAELSESLNTASRSPTPTMKDRMETPRPHSAVPNAPSRICNPKQRHLTCGIHNPDSVHVENMCRSTIVGVSECDSPSSSGEKPHGAQTNEKEDGVKSLDLRVRSEAGVTVLWARLCKPSDIVYKNAAWPSRPRAAAHSRPDRQKRPASQNAALSAGVVLETHPGDKNKHSETAHGGEPPFTTNGSDHVKQDDEPKLNGNRASSAPLHVLEQDLSESSWRRVNERRRVFRGYSDRSRRQQTWDPGSVFYADGARHHRSGMRAGRVGKVRGDNSAVGSDKREDIVGEKERDSRHRRRPGSLDVEGPVVDMHWNEVDTKRFSDAVEEMRAKLEGKLLVVVANDEGGANLDECFREARELLDASGQLLGWPHILRGRFKKKFGGDCRIGNYVATVSRLSFLCTATCGVVVILDMMRRREELVKDFLSACSSNDTTSSFNKGQGLRTTEAADKKSFAEDPGANTGSYRDDRMKAFENRLEIAEYSIAIAESLKSWTAYTPWRVRVLWEGEDMLSTLGAEEEAIPWPPEPREDPDHVIHVQVEKCTDTDMTIDEVTSFAPQALEESGSDAAGDEGTVVLAGQSADDSEVWLRERETVMLAVPDVDMTGLAAGEARAV